MKMSSNEIQRVMFSPTKHLKKKRFYVAKNALKLTYSNVEIQQFDGVDHRTPRFKRKGGVGVGNGGEGECVPQNQYLPLHRWM